MLQSPILFFFSSRRRHTRSLCDWSSDVCSSDLDGNQSAVRLAAEDLPLKRIHYAWIVAAVTFVALMGAAGFRATPGVLIVPLEHEFGWNRAVISFAVFKIGRASCRERG